SISGIMMSVMTQSGRRSGIRASASRLQGDSWALCPPSSIVLTRSATISGSSSTMKNFMIRREFSRSLGQKASGAGLFSGARQPGHGGLRPGERAFFGVEHETGVMAQGEPSTSVLRIAPVLLEAEAAVFAPEDIDAMVPGVVLDRIQHFRSHLDFPPDYHSPMSSL